MVMIQAQMTRIAKNPPAIPANVPINLPVDQMIYYYVELVP